MSSRPTTLTLTTGHLPWYKRRAQRWAYLNSLPSRRLLALYLAVFFIFSIFGPYQNLLHDRRFPIIVMFFLAVTNGAYSMLYPYLLIKRPIIFVGLTGLFHSVINTACMFIAFALTSRYPRWRPAGLVFTGNTIWICVVFSYILFLHFIRTQAREALRIQNELNLAHSIQQTLVPPVSLSTAAFEAYGVSLPSDRVGGDLVDIVPIRGGIIAYVADIAGHGLQAGILMGMFKTAARTTLLDQGTPAADALPILLERLDRVLPMVKEAQMYATMAALQLGEDGVVRYSLAAHPSILHYHAATRSITTLKIEQVPLGLLTTPPFSANPPFSAHPVYTEPGDLLVILTDGILEACNQQDEEFGTDRVEQVVSAHPDEPLASLATRITGAAHAFGPQSDDQTLLLVRRRSR
jgi:serine phosphatase RsbU (regulator of sigma subunit)